MAKISNQEAYPLISNLSGSDYLVLTDADSNPIEKQTKTVTVNQLAGYINGSGGEGLCSPYIVLQNVNSCDNPYNSNVAVISNNYTSSDQVGIYNFVTKTGHTPGTETPNDLFYGTFNRIVYNGTDPIGEIYGTYNLVDLSTIADATISNGIYGSVNVAKLQQGGQKIVGVVGGAHNQSILNSNTHTGNITNAIGTQSTIDITAPFSTVNYAYGHLIDLSFNGSTVYEGYGICMRTSVTNSNNIQEFTYLETKDTVPVATTTKFIKSTLDVPSELAGHLEAKSLTLTDCPIFADNVAATNGGLTDGDVYQTDGTAENPLNVPGILMIVQPDIQPTEYTVVLNLTNSIVDNEPGAPNYQLNGAQNGSTVTGTAGTSYEFLTTGVANQGFEFDPAFSSTNPSGLIPVGGATVNGELTGTIVPLPPNDFVVTMTPLTNNIVDLNPGAPNYTITGNLQGDTITGQQGTAYAFTTVVTPNQGYRFDTNNPFNPTNPSGTIPGNNLDVEQVLAGKIIPDSDVTVTMTPLVNNILDNEPGGPHYTLTGDQDGATQSGQPFVETYSFTTGVTVDPGFAFDTNNPFTATDPSGTFQATNQNVTQTVGGTIVPVADVTVTMTPLLNNIVDNTAGAPNYTLTGDLQGAQQQGQPFVDTYAFVTGANVNAGFQFEASNPFTATNPTGTFQATNQNVQQVVSGTVIASSNEDPYNPIEGQARLIKTDAISQIQLYDLDFNPLSPPNPFATIPSGYNLAGVSDDFTKMIVTGDTTNPLTALQSVDSGQTFTTVNVFIVGAADRTDWKKTKMSKSGGVAISLINVGEPSTDRRLIISRNGLSSWSEINIATLPPLNTWSNIIDIRQIDMSAGGKFIFMTLLLEDPNVGGLTKSFYSTNYGASFVSTDAITGPLTNSGIVGMISGKGEYITLINATSSFTYSSSYQSTDYGQTWTQKDYSGLSDTISSIMGSSGVAQNTDGKYYAIAGTNFNTILWHGSNFANTLPQSSRTGIQAPNVRTSNSGLTIIGTDSSDPTPAYDYSTDGGLTWTTTNNAGNIGDGPTFLIDVGFPIDDYVPVESTTAQFLSGISQPPYIATVTENGSALSFVTPQPSFGVPTNTQPWIDASDNYEYALAGAGNNSSISLSTDFGASWTTVPGVSGGSEQFTRVSKSGKVMVTIDASVSTRHKFWVTNDFGSTWIDQATKFDALFPAGINFLRAESPTLSGNGQYIYVGISDDTNPTATNGYIVRSTDFGVTWDIVSNNMFGSRFNLLDTSCSGTGQYVAAIGQVVDFPSLENQYSDDFGQTWKLSTTQVNVNANNSMRQSFDGQYVAGGTFNTPLYVSSDYGASYTLVNGVQGEYLSMSNTGQFMFMDRSINGLDYLSSDFGASWNALTRPATSPFITGEVFLIDT
jgi:hypothetical protein